MSEEIKRSVLDYNDIIELVPALRGHEKLVNKAIHWIALDKVNAVHDKYCDDPGVEFSRNLLKDFDINLKVDGRETLERLPEGAFITVSNHPFGALDGISLIALMGSIRPDFKVMVNMVLNHISAMRPNFIAVDALASDDPAKKAVSMKGIKEAIVHVRRGKPLGFFPAGAVSKINSRLRIEDRQWQPTIIRLIQQLNVPVIPIYFHGHNSVWFNILGLIDWRLRTLRLPAEVWRKCHSTIHVSVGDIITPGQLAEHPEIDDLGKFLKEKTYQLRDRK